MSRGLGSAWRPGLGRHGQGTTHGGTMVAHRESRLMGGGVDAPGPPGSQGRAAVCLPSGRWSLHSCLNFVPVSPLLCHTYTRCLACHSPVACDQCCRGDVPPPCACTGSMMAVPSRNCGQLPRKCSTPRWGCGWRDDTRTPSRRIPRRAPQSTLLQRVARLMLGLPCVRASVLDARACDGAWAGWWLGINEEGGMRRRCVVAELSRPADARHARHWARR